MANTKSVAKRARQAERRHEANKAIKSRVKTHRRKVTDAVEAGKKEEAETAFREFSAALDQAAKANVIHKNRVAKQRSGLSRRIAGK